MRPLYFEQDGGYFFVRLQPFYQIHFDAEPVLASNVCPSDLWIAPCRVRDFNDEDCDRAIALFELECARNGFVPVRAPSYRDQPVLHEHPATEWPAIIASLTEDGLPAYRVERDAYYATLEA